MSRDGYGSPILTGSSETLAVPARQAGSIATTTTSATCNRNPSLARVMRSTRLRPSATALTLKGGATDEHDEMRLREPDHARPWGARLHSVRATMLPRLRRLPRICHVLRPMCRRAAGARGHRSYRAREDEP